MNVNDISLEIRAVAEEAQAALAQQFAKIDSVAFKNTEKVMLAFQNNRVGEACFAGTTGYGYDDLGRDTLDKIYADVFNTEAALVRTGFVNGTHALTAGLFSMLAPGETLLAVTGAPYDTLRRAVGIGNPEFGSLAFYGIKYSQIDLLPSGMADIPSILAALNDKCVKAVFIQRSRGYELRRALSVKEIGEICSAVRSVRDDVYIMVDNCYGEFTELTEPTDVGADLIAGSLIKNPGGGLAPMGGYLAGKKVLIERAAARLTSPGIGGECGASLNSNRQLYQGLFVAPHVVAQALKTAVFCAYVMEKKGYRTSPAYNESRSDIIQMIQFNDPNMMKAFCKGIQAGAPVDSYVSPEPWQMPGYDYPVIMAAGSFIQGSSIELSADGPFVPPYTVYMQGGITFESGMLGIMLALSGM